MIYNLDFLGERKREREDCFVVSVGEMVYVCACIWCMFFNLIKKANLIDVNRISVASLVAPGLTSSDLEAPG